MEGGENMSIDSLLNGGVQEISFSIGLIYMGLLYFLPEKLAKKIEPLGKFLQFLAKTPGGIKKK